MSVLELTEYQYHSDQIDSERVSLSRSLIHEMCSKSPAHARVKHPRLNPFVVAEKRAKREFDVGKSTHEILLEGKSSVDVLSFDNWTTKAARETEAESRAHGRIPLLEHEWELVEQMVDAVRPQLDEFDPVPFTEGVAEQTLVWERHGALIRCRPDWIRNDLSLIEDFKTATSADPRAWSKRAVEYGYDLQAVLYPMALEFSRGGFADYRCIVVEKQPPFLVTEFKFAPDVLTLAYRKMEWAIETWVSCLETGVWPGYASETCWVNLEPWHESQWLDREARWAA